MPHIASYDRVLQALGDKGLKCLYPNGGSFGFSPGEAVFHLGWIGPEDETIRPEIRPFTRRIKPPYAENLVRSALEAWEKCLAGEVWALPKSHWAYELDSGSAAWLPGALKAVGIGERDLDGLTRGEAIVFEWGESHEFGSFLRCLLDNLSGSSDFQLVWPDRRVLCTVHHHQQLWWTSAEELLIRELDELVSRGSR